MSKTPAPPRRPSKTSVGSRSFARRQKAQRVRDQRKQAWLARGRRESPLRALAAKLPLAAWLCVLVAFLNAAAWSIVTPPFQGRDEVDHYAYVQHLAEKGSPPSAGEDHGVFSPGEGLVLQYLHYGEVRFTPYTPSITSAADQRSLVEADHANVPHEGTEVGGTAGAPPLFYALQTVPYALGGHNILVQLQLMRLLSALFGAVTALLVFLFLREALLSTPWAATIGALCVALQPQFAATSGSVNPDALVYAICAGVFLCLARAFRRRLTRPVALATGALIAAGYLTYPSFIGFAAGTLVALAALAVREGRAWGRRALLEPAFGVGVAAAPIALYGMVNDLSGRATFGGASKVASTALVQSPLNEISYIWQLYLPRLPGMTRYFEGISTWHDIWFDRSVGLYGWMDTMFPVWVDNVALVLALLTLLLCLRGLYVARERVKARAVELASYAVISVGVLATIGVASYQNDVIEHELSFGEPRYLLLMLPLLGAGLAMAVRGAGHRWAPVAGAALVALFIGHDLFSQLQVIARFYG